MKFLDLTAYVPHSKPKAPPSSAAIKSIILLLLISCDLFREKYRKVKSKFRYLPANYTSFYKAVEEMRKATRLEEQGIKEAQKQQASSYQPW